MEFMNLSRTLISRNQFFIHNYPVFHEQFLDTGSCWCSHPWILTLLDTDRCYPQCLSSTSVPEEAWRTHGTYPFILSTAWFLVKKRSAWTPSSCNLSSSRGKPKPISRDGATMGFCGTTGALQSTSSTINYKWNYSIHTVFCVCL